ncbi:Scr1 family TA system antitoxin-like transcriptional regulator [Streptomyces sp. NPDC057362]|uniref:Scr1 family TA system antitoxin-like transcriptional regulator n=1 Tax=unclassified Streptomyces TaxID=2593676 RepID=UPI003644FF7E
MGEKQHVELQVMPTDREHNAGVDGAFTVITRKDGMRFVHTEAQGTSALIRVSREAWAGFIGR